MLEFSIDGLFKIDQVLLEYESYLQSGKNYPNIQEHKDIFLEKIEKIKNRLVLIENIFRLKISNINVEENSKTSKKDDFMETPTGDTPLGILKTKLMKLDQQNDNMVSDVKKDLGNEKNEIVINDSTPINNVSNTPTPGNPIFSKSRADYKDLIYKNVIDRLNFNSNYAIDESQDSILFKVKNTQNEEMLLKIFKNNNQTNFLNELRSLKRLQNSRYIIKMQTNDIIDESFPYIIYENYCFKSFKTVLQEIHKSNENKEFKIFFFFIQIYFALCEMHYNGVLKNEFHLNDIMYDSSKGQIYIYRFNSLIVEGFTEKKHEKIKNDIFLLGKILLEMIFTVNGISYTDEDDYLSLISKHTKIMSKNLYKFLLNLIDVESDVSLVNIQFYTWFEENKFNLINIPANSLVEVFNKL